MAQRGKRINRNDNDSASCPGAIKRRKCRVGPSTTDTPLPVTTLGPSEEEETMASSSQGGTSWTPRPLSDIKISSIYNRSAAEPPAELYRKDLISAMKLPDSEPLSPSEYWIISDQWKQEWEKGVQVPVNPDSLPEPMVTLIQTPPISKLYGEFKLPKKFLRISRDDCFNSEDHYLSTTPARAEKACGYDLDDTDIAWLEVLNGERALCSQPSITESQLERVIEELEHRCWDKIQTIVKNEEGLGIEYDENVICDVCRSPDSEEGNEMVFCDFCNICVHQACYGITSIPDGSWLCRTCSLGQRPECVLCPNAGGAMKSTRSGQKWAHVSCALWIPEVSIGCVERMEPITKISSIPQSRWALICVLCRERVGACIQCSIKTCKTAYHVTCAFKHGLEMKAIIEDEQAEDGVKLRSYCQKHGKINTKEKASGAGTGSGSGKGGSDSDEGEVRRRKRKDMSSEEKNQARAVKLQEIEAEFDKHVCLKELTNQQVDVDPEAIVYIYNYWKLKRRSGHNKPLLQPRCGELSGSGLRVQGQAADNEKMRKFVQLRQDLERVRNLCYMVNRREKLCRTFLRLREQTFHKQVLLISGTTMPTTVATAVLEANHGPSIYDHLYSHQEAETHSHDIESLLIRIKGIDTQNISHSIEENKHRQNFNGASNKTLHFNGAVPHKKLYSSDLSSISSSETDQPKPTKHTTSGKVNNNKKLYQLGKNKIVPKIETESSTEDDDKQTILINKISSSKINQRYKSKKASLPDRPCIPIRKVVDESSESDMKPETAALRSRTLQHMERELGSASGSESDELLPISNKSTTSRLGPTSIAEIYSDTDDSSMEHSSNVAFSGEKINNKCLIFSETSKKKDKDKDLKDNKDNKDSKEFLNDVDKNNISIKNKENQKFVHKNKECIASTLIVPQRQAAKKASEIMQRSQNKKEISTASTSGVITMIINEQLPITKSFIEDIKPIVKLSKDIKDIKESKLSSSLSLSKKYKQENKLLSKEVLKDSKGNDIYDFDKEFGDGSEIFAYVPQRQAAKKAAEHIKSGISAKSLIVVTESDISENKLKKEASEFSVSANKKKQETKKEDSPINDETLLTKKKPSKTKIIKAPLVSSSTSSSSSYSSSSDTSSDSDEIKSSKQLIYQASNIKEHVTSMIISPETDCEQHFNNRNKVDTSSKNRQSQNETKSKLENKIDIEIESKTIEKDIKKLCSLSSSLVTGRKLKKLPEKKLKTSDGRHGHEFQPPSTERDESGRISSTSYKNEIKDYKQCKESQQKQLSNKHKSVECKDNNTKKSVSVQPHQQHRNRQQYESQTQTTEGVLSGFGDNDGTRNFVKVKSFKKSSNISKYSHQQSRYQSSDSIKIKKDISVISKGKITENRKRKLVHIAQREENNINKHTASIKQVEKKVSNISNEKLCLSDGVESNYTCTKERVATVEPIQKISIQTFESSLSRSDSKKSKKVINKNNIVSLEDEMKQRRAVRDSPKKSSKGLDKLLEKREHLDKLSRSKNIKTSKQEKVHLSEKIDEFKSSESQNIVSVLKCNEQVKSEDSKFSTIENENSIDKNIPFNDYAIRISSEIIPKDDLFDIPHIERITEGDKIDASINDNEYISNLKQQQLHLNKDNNNKDNNDILLSKPLLEKFGAINEINKKENSNKRHRSVNRSIFSPQHGSKDTSVPELFDFDQDILTDDMVNDDGFSIPRDVEERSAPLTFSFNNDLWFKEDTKEDSARETLHLVEKLRMELSKKSHSSQLDLESTIATTASVDVEITDSHIIETKIKNHIQQYQLLSMEKQEDKMMSESTNSDLKGNINSTASHFVDEIVQTETQVESKKKSCFENNCESTYLMYDGEDLECGKVAMAERAKLDRAEADERWVPPSIDNFNNTEQFSAIIESQDHRYGITNQQFSNELNTTILTGENANTNANLVHSQLHTDIEEQQYMLRAGIETHGEQIRSVPGLASIVEQQISSLPGQVISDIAPIEIVNRHIISIPGVDDDQTNDLDQAVDKDEIGSDIVRQDYISGVSPYNDLTVVRQDTRWAESQVLPSRRSTSSSITSSSSVDDHSNIPPYKNSGNSSMTTVNFPSCTVETTIASYTTYERTSNYGGPISLFPSQSNSAQLSYPSPGTGMFPPAFGAPFPTNQSLLPQVSKPLEEQIALQASPCTAAFTSSSQNMAFTAAMVSPCKLPSSPTIQLTLEENESQQESIVDIYEQQKNHGQKEVEELLVEESSAVAVTTALLDNITESDLTEQSVEVILNEQIQVCAKNTSLHLGKKSPAKPTRTSARVTSLQGKSPGKSPRQQEPPKFSSTNRTRGRGSKSLQHIGQRGRGRGRGRGRSKILQHNSALQGDDSIHNKLIGSVYDFDSDEDSPSEANIADLRTMRERKKSIEISIVLGNDRRDGIGDLNIDTLNNQNPISEEQQNRHVSAAAPLTFGGDSITSSPCEPGNRCTFNDSVLPLLPGPVDMRTYNSSLEVSNTVLHNRSYSNNLLGSLTSVSTEHVIPDIEEDLDKELNSTLIVQQLQEPEHTTSGTSFEVDAAALVCDSSKVALADSRNQLKVKIKGPFLDANYTGGSTVSLPLSQQVKPIVPPQSSNTTVASSGTSNLRRMRKKELLRQYCSQDMNMDDPAAVNVASAPIVMPPINRTVITIPKAVASMTSIPTREDYKAVVDANMEKKRRKERASFGGLPGLFNETQGVEEDQQFSNLEHRRSSCGPIAGTERRRGRQPRSLTQSYTPIGTPKLKIKIGGSTSGQESSLNLQQEDRSSNKPPKKRLCSIPNMPSMEELKRESMKYRRMIMADFVNSDEKAGKLRKEKRDKNGKRKKRQNIKKEGCVQILEDGAAPPRLIIRLGKSNQSSGDEIATENIKTSNSTPMVTILSTAITTATRAMMTINDYEKPRLVSPSLAILEEDPVNSNSDLTRYISEQEQHLGHSSLTALKNVRCAKVSPIKLKLTRCQEGYELKSPGSLEEQQIMQSDLKKQQHYESQPKINDEKTSSSKVDEKLPLLDHSATTQHNSSGCPAKQLPQGCQVR